MDKIKRLRDKMEEQEVDLIVLAPGANLNWLIGVNPHADERPLLFFLTLSDSAFLMPELEAKSARQHTDIEFYNWSDASGPLTAVDRVLSDMKSHSFRTFVIDDTMRADHAAIIQDKLKNLKRLFTSSTIGVLRMQKDTGEQKILRINAHQADLAMQRAWEIIKPGLSEEDIALAIQNSFSDQGASPQFSIVASGENSAFPHHQTGSRKLKEGDAIVIDLGGRFERYTSDITRMSTIGNPHKDYALVHQIVEDAICAALKAAIPGEIAKNVDKAAREAIEKEGFGKYFVHRTGHGLGTEIHEAPFITSSSETILEPGMVFSIEPGIYMPGKFGVRLEEIVILHDDGPEILSKIPRELKVINHS
jgi:Xaa-Pro dipeptidase